MKRLLAVAALSMLGCDAPPPARGCHLATVEVLLLPAHRCTLYQGTDEGVVAYEAFCPDQCRIVTTCILWCDQVSKHSPHLTITSNVGSNSARCDEHGQLRF